MNKTKNAENKGITLIALIITIIIMLILVTVSITMAVKGGLFNYAGKATKETQNAITAEQMLAEGKIQIDGFFYNSYQDYLDGIYSENQPNAPIQLTYSLSNNELTRGEVNIYIYSEYKNYLDYSEYAEPILRKLEETITNKNELKAKKEEILLEGINWECVNYDCWNGEGYDSLEEFVDYINENDGPDPLYTNIYDYMKNQNGDEDGTDEDEIINNYLLYYDWFVEPQGYQDLCDNYYENIEITTPDGTKVEGGFQVSKNGNYSFIATNKAGEKGAITVRVTNIIEEKFSNIYKETTEYKENGKTVAWIPKGFAVGIESDNIVINKVSEGLVITDKVDNEGHSIGNEFVWVPVEIKETDSKTSIAAMERTAWADNKPTTDLDAKYTEPNASGYEGEDDEYEDMLESVYTYGGFYIGRYEAGSETPRYDTSNGTTEMSVKRGKYPYNYVGWGPAMNSYEGTVTYVGKNQGYGAVKLSKDLYKEKDVGVTSTLIYGSQWDATLRFVKDDNHNVNDSINWGNYDVSSFIFTGKYNTSLSGSTWNDAKEMTKPASKGYLITTGASDQNKAKNIYNLAGNVFEWTMESNASNRVLRGGKCFNFGSPIPASFRYPVETKLTNCYSGFRVSLYMS